MADCQPGEEERILNTDKKAKDGRRKATLDCENNKKGRRIAFCLVVVLFFVHFLLLLLSFYTHTHTHTPRKALKRRGRSGEEKWRRMWKATREESGRREKKGIRDFIEIRKLR